LLATTRQHHRLPETQDCTFLVAQLQQNVSQAGKNDTFRMWIPEGPATLQRTLQLISGAGELTVARKHLTELPGAARLSRMVTEQSIRIRRGLQIADRLLEILDSSEGCTGFLACQSSLRVKMEPIELPTLPERGEHTHGFHCTRYTSFVLEHACDGGRWTRPKIFHYNEVCVRKALISHQPYPREH
jgi:hypothetical protein